MVDNPVWKICARVAEVQALLHHHIECGKHTDVVAKAQAVLAPICCGRCSMSATSRRTPRRLNRLDHFGLNYQQKTLVGVTRWSDLRRPMPSSEGRE